MGSLPSASAARYLPRGLSAPGPMLPIVLEGYAAAALDTVAAHVNRLMEIAELPARQHPFFLGTQFHPEFKSRPLKPHPLFREFIKAALKKKSVAKPGKGGGSARSAPSALNKKKKK